MSEEYSRFAALLTRIVTTPKSVTDAREKEIEDAKSWRKRYGLPAKRIMLAAPVSDADAKRP